MKTWLALALLVSPFAAQDASLYVPVEDGTRLAVDVYLPDGVALSSDDVRVPALFELTRYWRRSEDPRSGVSRPALRPLDRAFLEAGYALVKVDVRGSGASFGTREMEYGRREVRDGYDLVEWAVSQPWCDGAVGAYGTSYTGTTAELLAACGHPAVKAVIPGWSDFDLYTSPARPYGLYATLVDRWGQLVGAMDANDATQMGGFVARVDADTDGAQRDDAVRGHAGNIDVGPASRAAEFRDDRFGGGGDTYANAASTQWKDEIEASGVAMLVLASWFDAGTAGGALTRFQHYSNPQKLVLLASSHGGFFDASPYTVANTPLPPRPSVEEQVAMRIDFFDHYLRDMESGVDDWPAVRYWNLGVEELLASEEWPPAGTERERLYLGESELDSNAPAEPKWRRHEVDLGVTTGRNNRWWTQLGGPVFGLHDRGAMDERMVTWTSGVLEADLQLTGTPCAHLRLRANREDVGVLVYLEDVDPSGRSRYVTEGGLRALHRAPWDDPKLPDELHAHSFARADAQALVPGEEFELEFSLWPTSVVFRAGHRIRIAVTAADADTFARLEGDEGLVLEIAGDSFVELPIVRAGE